MVPAILAYSHCVAVYDAEWWGSFPFPVPHLLLQSKVQHGGKKTGGTREAGEENKGANVDTDGIIYAETKDAPQWRRRKVSRSILLCL